MLAETAADPPRSVRESAFATGATGTSREARARRSAQIDGDESSNRLARVIAIGTPIRELTAEPGFTPDIRGLRQLFGSQKCC